MEIQLWRELLDPYQLAVDELVVKFNHVITEHRSRGLYSPIESVEGRLKSIVSILDKMKRKNVSMNDIEKKIEDIAGLRINCQFVEDIDRVVKLIKQRTDMKVKCEKDYIRHMKASGYRSYHMIIEYKVNTVKGEKTLSAEIQIRTMAMNFWATIEHSLQYKYKENIPDYIQKKLIDASQAIVEIDKAMSDVRDEIMDAQNSHQKKENLVKDILNNIQNLYRVANKREVTKIQDEFYKVYVMDDMMQLQHFASQLDIISEGYRAQSLT
ncbi:MAG: GTP pyrophosphokinase family protein [Eubacteriales bacterium]|nr:GTP pyrophosphokinase family protein [Eubacteriales bacterium]